MDVPRTKTPTSPTLFFPAIPPSAPVGPSRSARSSSAGRGEPAGCYVGPDGASHFFQVGVGQFGKAEDASQLILHDQGTTTAGPYEMWDGDGNRYVLDYHVSGLDDDPLDENNNGYAHDFGNGRDGWYLSSVYPFGNTYSVRYRSSADLPCWTYFDTNCAGARTSTHWCLASGASWVPESLTFPRGPSRSAPGRIPT